MNAAANLTVIDRPEAALDTPEKTILVLAYEEKGALYLRFEPEIIIFKAPAGAARKVTATIRAADGIKLAFDGYQIADPSTVVKSDISRDGQTMTIHFAFPNLFLLQGLNYFFKGSLPPRDGTDESTPVSTVYEGDPQVGNDPPTNQESRLLTRPVAG